LYQAAGYKDKDFEDIPVRMPVSLSEELDTKPYVQTAWKKLCQLNGPITTEDQARKYIQFYAYLSSLVDREIARVLLELDRNGYKDDTLIIRISDHGDMAMAHGMQRQKMYNVYRETLNIPMIFSNPNLSPQTTESLSGLVDIMSTLATIAGADPSK
ncbi:MAG: sulfatase-like hydrolase/transferase, partial [Sinomicrobium sp.]|nr:sulfatase-like hydrolase/transferase [Sinomicrobium sp.]